MAKGDKGAKPKATAVVFVHGQGEQAPMDDLLQLAFSIWETEPRASQGAQLANIASVPVDQAEIGDLRCLISDVVDDAADGEAGSRQFHFYQFYWAHLMRDNQLLDLWRWLIRLLKRPKNEVPEALFKLRGALLVSMWAIVVSAVLFSILPALRLVGPAAPYGGVVSLAYAFLWTACAVTLVVLATRWRKMLEVLMTVSVSAIIAGMAFGSTMEDRIPGTARFLKGDGLGANQRVVEITNRGLETAICIFDMNPDPGSLTRRFCENPKTTRALAQACRGSGVYRDENLGACNDAMRLWPLTWWSAAAAAHRTLMTLGALLYLGLLIGWGILAQFLKSVMTDSARYFSNDPRNVAQRDEIRSSGVALLERLHKSNRFDRIIVVAHSLGTVVAYNMLDHYWGTVRQRLICEGEDSALRRVERESHLLDEATSDELGGRVTAFRDAQRAYSRALAKLRNLNPKTGEKDRPWLVSDLVTLGSPLTYAKLLAVDSVAEFTAKKDKFFRLPACPPVSGEVVGQGDQTRRKLSDSWLGEALGDPRAPLPSAMFAAMRWTNLYFTNNGLGGGDIVGGAVAPIFGRGVIDVEIDRNQLGKGFLHNEYWKWPEQNKASAWQAAGETRSYTSPPPHIARLRQAVNLFENPQYEVQLRVKTAPTAPKRRRAR